MSDSDSLGGSASDVSGGTPPTNARRAAGRRRRVQVIGVLAAVAIAATVIVGITTSGSRSGTLATDYAGATLTCAAFPGQTVLTLKEFPTNVAIHVRWDGDPDGWVTEINGDYEMSTSMKTWSVDTGTQFGFGLESVTVSQTVGTDTWSISASCT